MNVKIAACAVAALLASSASAQELPATNEFVDVWSKRFLDEEGWLRIGWTVTPKGGFDKVWLISSLPNESVTPIVRDWLRVENKITPGAVEQSRLMLVEFHCANRRYRFLDAYSYALTNMRGRMVPKADGPGPMETPVPGSIMATALDTVCKGAR
jgi:hypothetical protein